MSKKSSIGLRARVVASHRKLRSQVAEASSRALQLGSTSVQEALSACIGSAVPKESPLVAIEPLESRQLLSTTVYSSTAAPAAANLNVQDGIWTSNNGLELGAKFTSTENGEITGVRFYKGSQNTGTHTGEVWNSSGTLLTSATFTNETASGWQEVDFANPVAVTAGQTYVVSYHTYAQYMAFTPEALSSAMTNGPVSLSANGGVFNYGYNSVFPTETYESGSYWVDAVFSASTTAVSSVYAASSAPTSADLNVQDGIWTSNNGLELGAKFTSTENGYITGVRFYKGSLNTGTHTGEVWNSSGTLLATATFTNETASGWQQVNFSSPVAVTAGQTYVVSYHTYAQYMAFTPEGLSSSISNGPISIEANGGVFNYGYNSVYPTQSYESGTYWVDAVFSASSPSVSLSPPAPASPPPTSISSPYSPKAVISLQGGNGEAGHSVFVNGLSSSLGSGTQLNATYSWNFGDPNGQYNTLAGWNAGHIYDTSGTYTITLTVTNDLGYSSTATTQVIISPNVNTTIYVNTSGNDANSGLSASAPIASESRLAQLLNSYGNSNVTVLFARGETFDMQYYLYVEGSNETFSAYGSGAAPVIYEMPSPTGDSGVFYMTSAANQIDIENLTFNTPDAAPADNAPEIIATAIFPNGTNITVRDNTFLNMEDDMDCYQGPNGLLVENNSSPLLTGLRGYFIWMNGTNGVVLGNTVVNSTRQHVMRSNYSTTQDWLIAGNNFTSDDNPADPGEIPKTTINLRQGSDIYIYDNTLADAAVSFGPTDDMPTTAFVSWVKFDGNTVNNTEVELSGSIENAMLSNNLTNLSGIYPQYQIVPTDDMGRQMSNVTIENNTGVLTGQIGTFLDIEGNSPADALIVKNNLFSAPDIEIGDDIATSVFIAASNANAVQLFSDNVWAAPVTTLLTSNPTAVNYIAPPNVLEDNYYLTEAQWDALSNVQGDQFKVVNINPSSGQLQVSVNGQMAGAVLPGTLT